MKSTNTNVTPSIPPPGVDDGVHNNDSLEDETPAVVRTHPAGTVEAPLGEDFNPHTTVELDAMTGVEGGLSTEVDTTTAPITADESLAAEGAGPPSPPITAAKSRAARALDIIQARYRLVYNDDKKAYAVDDSTPNPQSFRISSWEFASAARKLVYLTDRTLVLTNEDLGEIASQLEALADLIGEKAPVGLRVALTDHGLVIDIGDDTHAHIAAAPGSVKIIEEGSPTLFYRNPNFLPFVRPANQGDINLLLPYLNLVEKDQWLLIAWICYTLAHPKVPSTNYVILVLRGDRGSGKSTMCNITIGSLVGPSATGIQAFPSSQRDLAIATQNSHVVMYDNLRKLTPSQADMLCRCSTSAAVSTRQLYTDSQEFVHVLHCAMVLNGIHPFIEQEDLAQRCLTLTLQPLDPANRTTEKQLRDSFQKDLPAIFRGILDLIANTLVHLPNVTAKHPERMLEFVHWLAAMEKVLELPEGKLQYHYSKNLVGAMQDTLQDNPLADVVIEFAKQHDQEPWLGSPANLLLLLRQIADPQVITTREWPQNAIQLSLRLKKIRSQLSGAGVIVSIGNRARERQISINYTGRSS